MAESKAQQWSDAKRDILAALDLRAECSALGVRFSKDRPTSKGWLECHAVGRDDNNASAAVNVGDGPCRGLYKDQGDGRPAVSFWDLVIKTGRLPDFKTVLLHYAQRTGVKLPGEPEERDIDKADFHDATPGSLMLYTLGKNPPHAPVITIEGMLATGVRTAHTPRRLPPEKQNHLLVVPVFGPGLLNLEPIGWHGAPMNPRVKFRLFQGEGKEPKLLKVYSIGEASGLMGLDTLQRWDEIRVVHWCEGLTDLWAMQSAIIASGRKDHGCLAMAGAGMRLGAEFVHQLAGKEHGVWGDVGDEDGAGDTWAACLTTVLSPVGSVVKNCKLPVGAGGDVKMDVRKFLSEV